MSQKISRKEEILRRLESEGKVKWKDQPSDIQLMKDMNQDLLEIRRDFLVRERKSQIEAANVILTS